MGLGEITLPNDTILGALAEYVEIGSSSGFQPMGSNMGILPELPERIRNKQEKYAALAKRALDSLDRAIMKGN